MADARTVPLILLKELIVFKAYTHLVSTRFVAILRVIELNKIGRKQRTADKCTQLLLAVNVDDVSDFNIAPLAVGYLNDYLVKRIFCIEDPATPN